METFSKGLVQDTTLKTQVDGSYRYALNAVLETREDGVGAISNEIGNDLSASLPDGFRPIGHCLTDSDDVIIFAASSSSSIIGLFNPVTKTFTSVVQTDCLNFSQDRPISAQFRIRKGCNRTVYFTDNYNPYRFFDFDAQLLFQTSTGDWDCNKLAFFPLLDVPLIDEVQVLDQGGELLVGAYSFSIRYLDSDLNPTNFFFTTRPVNIYDDPIGGDYDQIDGAVNSTGEEGQLGAVPLTQKSIQLSLSGLDSDFRYFQVAVIVASEGTGAVSRVYLLPAQEISSVAQDFVVSTLTGSGVQITTIDDIAVDAPVFQRVKSHTQLHNRLFIGGVTSPQYDWASFQAAANNITVTWATEQVDALPDEDSVFEAGNSKHPNTPYERMSFTGDEVYALGVEFLFNNGTWSPVFHIPGRAAENSDRQLLQIGVDIAEEDVAHLGLDSGTIERWKVENTATDTALAFHEADVDYPSVTCNGSRVFPEGKIRHHRMPCRTQVPIYEMSDTNPKINLITLEFSNLVYPHADIVGHRWVKAKRQAADTTVVDTALLIGPSFPFLSADDPSETKTEFSGLFQSEDGTNENSDLFRLFSPRQILSYPTPRGTYVKFLGALSLSSAYQFGHEFDVSGTNTNGRSNLIRREYLSDVTTVPYKYRNIEQQFSIAIRSQQAIVNGLSLPLINYSYSNPYRIVQLSTELPNWEASTITLQYNLFGQEEPLSSTERDENSNFIYQVVLKKLADPFSNLTGITYVPLNNSALALTDSQKVYGDTYISELVYFDLFSKSQIEEGQIRFDLFAADVLSRTYLESKVAFDLRHEGDDTCNRIFKVTEYPHTHLLNKVAIPDGTA